MSPQVFLINKDGTTKELQSDGPVKDILKTEECYVLVADDIRKVFLWKGVASNVRSKFIGAKRSQEIRGQVGMHYAVVPLDEGDEDADFIKIIGGQTEAGHAKEIKDDETAAPSGYPLREKNVFGTPKPAACMNIAGSKTKNIQNTGPLYTGQSSKPSYMEDKPQIDFQEVMQKLEEIQMPAGYERELIIIGNHAYSIVEKTQEFLGKKQVTKEISKVGSIPEGIFFAENYAPRILSENGVIIAIEFLKRLDSAKPITKKTKRETLKDQIKQQLGGK